MTALSKTGEAVLEVAETAGATFVLFFVVAAPTSFSDAKAAALAGITAGLMAAYKAIAALVPPSLGVPRLFASRSGR